jgi:hypothetical protein
MADKAQGSDQRGGLHLLAWGILIGVGVLLYHQSYQRWGDLIIDLGRDLYLPGQILDGRILYRDLLYNYGPVAPYLLAGMVALFGDSLRTFAAAGMLSGISCMAALYLTGWRLGNVTAGFGASLLFLVCSFFANSTWGCNFVLPYSHAATFGMAFALWSFYFLCRYLYAGRRSGHLSAGAAFLLLAAFSKQEIGIAVAGVYLLAMCLHRFPWKAVLGITSAAAAAFLIFIAIFHARGGIEHSLFADNLSPAKFGGGYGDPFFLQVAGLDHPWMRAGAILLRLAALALMLWGVGLAASAPSLVRRRKIALAILCACALPAAAIAAWLFADIHLLSGAAPAAAMLILYFAFRRRWRDPLCLAAAFVILSSLRIPLSGAPLWYGFYLSVPAYLFVTQGLAHRLPDWRLAPRFLMTALAVIGVIVLLRFEASMLYGFDPDGGYRNMTSRLETAKGIMRDFPNGRVESIAEFLSYMERKSAEDRAEGMVVIPEGLTLNYFTGIRNPSAYYLFIPPEMRPRGIEEQMRREFAATRPRYVVWNARNVQEFGVRQFGVDYGTLLGGFISQNYEVEASFPAETRTGTPAYRIILMRLKDSR